MVAELARRIRSSRTALPRPDLRAVIPNILDGLVIKIPRVHALGEIPI